MDAFVGGVNPKSSLCLSRVGIVLVMGKEDFRPGGWNDYAQQSVDNSERAPGTYCPPPSLLSGTPSAGPGGKGGGLGGDLATNFAKTLTRDGFIRVALSGNVLHTLITPDGVDKLDRTFRKLPPVGMQGATPSNPMTFELGAVSVPRNMSFVILDTRFALYVPAEVPGDVRELEDRRLATSIGWDMKFTEKRPDNALYQLEPSVPTLANQTYASQTGVSAATFADLASGGGFAAVAGSALATLPQRHRRDSQFAMPFTYVVAQNQRVNLNAVVFRRVPIPLAFFEASITGFFVGANEIERFLRGIGATVKA